MTLTVAKHLLVITTVDFHVLHMLSLHLQLPNYALPGKGVKKKTTSRSSMATF